MFQVRIEDWDGRVLLWGPKFGNLWAACKEAARRNEEYPIPSPFLAAGKLAAAKRPKVLGSGDHRISTSPLSRVCEDCLHRFKRSENRSLKGRRYGQLCEGLCGRPDRA